MKLKLSIELDLLLAATLGVVLLAITGMGFFMESSRVVDAVSRQREIDARLNALHHLQDVLVEAESGQRSFLITGRDEDLAPYVQARAAAEGALSVVKRSYAEQPQRAGEVRRIEALCWAELTELARTVELRRSRGYAAALPANGDDNVQQAMRAFRHLVSDIAAAESAGLGTEMDRVRGGARQAFAMWVAGAGATVFVIGLFMYLALAQLRQNRLLAKRLQHDAHHDYLTGLPNRAQFMMTLHHTLERARREDTRAAVLYMDLNGFKPINDQLGHDVGDLVLIEVAKKLTSTLRASDLPARLGGDEFAVLVPRTNSERELEALAERVKTAVASITLPQLGERKVGCAVGWAMSADDDTSAESLLCAADRAMYRVKRSHRPAIAMSLI